MTGSRSALLRVVLSGDGTGDPVLVLDERRRMPGRGAWLHPDQRCLGLAVKRRALQRALRYAGPPGTDAVERAVMAIVNREQPQHSATVPERNPAPTVDRESGLEADGPPMSTHR